MSVCLSVRHTQVLYQNKEISLFCQNVMISSPSKSLNIPVIGNMRLIPKFERGHPERGRFMRLGWVRTGVFFLRFFDCISRRISETVQDRTGVTIEH